jgi:hypothetical protein
VIFDAFGSFVVPEAFKRFPSSIHVLRHWVMLRPWHLLDPRRYALDHRKLLVVDGETAFIGGYNIGQLYATVWSARSVSRNVVVRIGPRCYPLCVPDVVSRWQPATVCRRLPASLQICVQHPLARCVP